MATLGGGCGCEGGWPTGQQIMQMRSSFFYLVRVHTQHAFALCVNNTLISVHAHILGMTIWFTLVTLLQTSTANPLRIFGAAPKLRFIP